MTSDGVDFEADSPAAIGELLGAECDAWRKRQCVDRDWFKTDLLQRTSEATRASEVAVPAERWSLARESELLDLGESCVSMCAADCVLILICALRNKSWMQRLSSRNGRLSG